MLQIIEFGFKHTDVEVKSFSYDCWKSLIENFALEREFLLKSKKLNLIMMPLVHKCKTYKEESVCRSKILAWLCLIENVNDQLINYYGKILFPFFNYCFGLSGESAIQGEEDDEEKLKRFLSTKLEPLHHLKSLSFIGFEMLLMLIFNADFKRKENFKAKFAHVDFNVNYDIKETLEEDKFWLCLMKLFFDLYLPDKANSTNGHLVLEAWKCLGELFGLGNGSGSSRQHRVLVKFFLSKSIEFINSSFLDNYNKVEIDIVRYMLSIVQSEYDEFISSDDDMRGNTIKLVERISTVLLNSTENDINKLLDDFTCLLKFVESNQGLIDFCAWLHLATKLGEQLKQLGKPKSSSICINSANREAIDSCILFPFKYFKLLKSTLETDAKLNASTNLVKLYGGLLKQGRVRFEDTDESLVNVWCSGLFGLLMSAMKTESSMLPELLKHWTTIGPISAPQSTVEATLKLLQLTAQFIFFMLQNVFDFELVNSQPSDGTEEPTKFSILSKMESRAKRLERACDLFSASTELIIQLVELFYRTVMAFAPVDKQDAKDESLTGNQPRVENKQAVHIYVVLLEILSLLFTRIKSNEILNELLARFATSIEQISELGYFIFSHFKYFTFIAYTAVSLLVLFL